MQFPLLLTLTLALITADRPQPQPISDPPPVKLFEVPEYSEGVVFDHAGYGYISHGKTITRFTLDGKHETWAETGAPNGHKILADGTHLVCDASQKAVLKLSADGKLLDPASKECDGKPLRGPNDLTLDAANGGFYFTDPGGSSETELIGTVHYVDKAGKTHLLDEGLAFPNGTVLTPDGKRLLVAESGKNRVLSYAVSGPGRVGKREEFALLPAKDKDKGQIADAPDGMCLDAAGNLYVAHYGMKRVEVVDPTGKHIANYDGGNLTTSNVAFSGPKFDQLFVTGALGTEKGSKGAVFRLDIAKPGLKILPEKAAK